MTKKRTTSKDTTPARPQASVAAAEPVARHRKATPAKKAAQAPVSITQDDIARLAFSYFEQRGYQGGSPDADWLRAEEELMQLVG